jgi:probable 2-oxoglutarate dehydrogenase E1 component DHKTD1
MAHRGRLNILVGLLDYPARALFSKVRGKSDVPEGMDALDDVVSHIGQSVDKTYGARKLHVTMLNNPSHLEAVNPVAQGKTRAKQDAGRSALCVQLHGDAAFAGQGVVAESLLLTNLPGFTCKGECVRVRSRARWTSG